MKNILTILSISALVFLLSFCTSNQHKNESKSNLIAETISFSANQYSLMIDKIEDSEKIVNPKSIINGKMVYIPTTEWTSGFFPGSLWYLYELTNDEKWKPLAIKYTEALDTIQYYTGNHDVGFMINCSYGNGLRLTGNVAYKKVIINEIGRASCRERV